MLTRAPLILIAILACLALIGSKTRSFPLDASVECVYLMAGQDVPAADILFVGSSRTGRGVDPVYVQSRLQNNGLDVTVERIAMPSAQSQQFYPVIKTYLEERGAPKVIFMQIVYNYHLPRHHQMDVPINPSRNIAFADLDDVIAMHHRAQLNPSHSAVPRWLQSEYMSLPMTLLTRLEMNIYAALKYPIHLVTGRRSACQGEAMYRHNHPIRLFGDLDDDIAFVPETPNDTAWREHNAKITAQYMPIAPTAPLRTFENEQFRALKEMAEAAGSKVVMVYLPALGEVALPAGTEADFAEAFPDTPFLHPMSLYDGPEGAQLALSYYDTHHYTKYGALLVSRYFADRIPEFWP